MENLSCENHLMHFAVLVFFFPVRAGLGHFSKTPVSQKTVSS